MMKTGGGSFDPAERHIYFPASNPSMMRVGHEYLQHVLVAINDLKTATELALIDDWISKGIKVFIDSGIFNLTNEHMRAHGCTMDEALALAPEQIDGFDALFDRYVQLAKKYDPTCWGYIELDQGGKENKKRTRKRLEKLGLRPIPVYHPLNDGWDYFDELAKRYDRICVGNVVQASAPERLRIAATMWERHRKYPHLWIHLLGLTPNPLMCAFPTNSCDSSSWVAGARWGRIHEVAALRTMGGLSDGFTYVLGTEGDHYLKGIQMIAAQFEIMARNWRQQIAGMEAVGCDVYAKQKSAA